MSSKNILQNLESTSQTRAQDAPALGCDCVVQRKKDERSVNMKWVKKILYVLGGVLLMANMVGCDDQTSKAYMDNKFADLSRVYPTEDLADLFETFPKGFAIFHAQDAHYKGISVTVRLKLSGNPYTKEIAGTITLYAIAQDDTEEEILTTATRYEKGAFILREANVSLQSLLSDVRFVFQSVPLTKEVLNQATMTDRRANQSGIYGASYDITSTALQHYFGSHDAQFQLVLVGNKAYDDDNVFFRRMHVSPREGTGIITESITGIYTEVE